MVLHLLARVGREDVEVRRRDAAGRSRANTERGRKERRRGKRREDRRNAPSAVTLITTPSVLVLLIQLHSAVIT